MIWKLLIINYFCSTKKNQKCVKGKNNAFKPLIHILLYFQLQLQTGTRKRKIEFTLNAMNANLSNYFLTN